MENTYVLITPVRNEEKFLRFTIHNILEQTILPVRWVIVDDASTDATPKILKEYSDKFSFITTVRLNRDPRRSYGSRVKAVLVGYEKLADFHWKFLGILDADLSLPSDYYESIMDKFNMDERLGVAGGVVFDVENGKLDRSRANSLEHVAGGVQLFRRECYNAIGGYISLKWGGADFAAEVMARKLGFRTQSFPDIQVLHKRLTMSEEIKNKLFLKVRAGFMDYSIGYSRLYHTLKCMRKISEKPIILSAVARQFGYVLAAIKLGKPSIPPDLVQFVRTEQLAKIRDRTNVFRTDVNANIQ